MFADTKDESIFSTDKDYFKENNIPLMKIMDVAIDGMPEIVVVCHRGFIAFLKRKIMGILAIYCVIYRHHLVAKNLSDHLHQSLP